MENQNELNNKCDVYQRQLKDITLQRFEEGARGN